MANLVQFMREVKQESLKVTWPSRKEVVMTTFVVFIMVMVIGTILLTADSIISTGVEYILGAAHK